MIKVAGRRQTVHNANGTVFLLLLLQGMGQGMGQMRPGMAAVPAMGMQQPVMYSGMGSAMPGARMPQQQPATQNPQNDPFGAL